MAQIYTPKTFVFAGSPFGIQLSGLNAAGANLSLTTPYNIDGEVLEVFWQFNRAGSIYLTESGTGRELWRRNSASGVAGWQVSYPRVFGEIATAANGAITIGSNAANQGVPTMFPYMVNGPVVLNISGAASGAQPLSFMFRYR